MLSTFTHKNRTIGRAPKGGIEFGGKVYRGGQFCPLAAVIPPVCGGAPEAKKNLCSYCYESPVAGHQETPVGPRPLCEKCLAQLNPKAKIEQKYEAIEVKGRVIGLVIERIVGGFSDGFSWSIRNPIEVCGEWGDSLCSEPSRESAIDQIVSRKARGVAFAVRELSIEEYRSIRNGVRPIGGIAVTGTGE